MRAVIFISSVQKEFAKERKALAEYLREDELLKLFFKPYLFEEDAANGSAPGSVYLNEVKKSDIYLGILGKDYGYEDAEGISPTEREFDKARTESLPCWMFIQGNNDNERHPKEAKFVRKVGDLVSRKRFQTLEELKKEVYKSCIQYLKETGKIDTAEFDNSLHPYASLLDIDTEQLQDFVRQARYKRNFPLQESDTTEKILTHLNMYRQGKLTNSAILAFAKNPQAFFPSSSLKCAHFHGYHVEKPIPDYKEYSGTVFEMADGALDFVLSKISLSTGDRSQSILVPTKYEIPRAVLAEAIVNALAHRDYYSKGSIQLAIFKDRILIENPGKLPSELDLQKLKEPHSSFPHNPLLANAMFLTGAIERFGTGIPEIYKLTAEGGLKEPNFSDDHVFSITLWRPSAQTVQDISYTTVHDTDHDTVHETVQDTRHENFYIDIEELPLRLLWIFEGDMTRQEMMDSLELKSRNNFKINYLDVALDNKWIEMTMPDTPTSRFQQYRLTPLGKEQIAKLKNDLYYFNDHKTVHDTDHDAVQERGYEEHHKNDHDIARNTLNEEPSDGLYAGKFVRNNYLPLKLLNIMTKTMSRNEMMKILNLKHSQSFRASYLEPALIRGWVEMTIPETPKSKKQKYRLTQKGQLILDELAIKHN